MIQQTVKLKVKDCALRSSVQIQIKSTESLLVCETPKNHDILITAKRQINLKTEDFLVTCRMFENSVNEGLRHVEMLHSSAE